MHKHCSITMRYDPLPQRWKSAALFLAVILTMGLYGCASDYDTRRDALSPNALTRIADRSYNSGDYRTAANIYAQAAHKNSDDIPALLGLGQSLLRIDEPMRAEDAFGRLLLIDPDHRDALYGMGKAYITQEKTDAAIREFGKLLALEPKNSRALNGLGLAYDLAGEHHSAQRAYLSGLKTSGKKPALYNNLALSLALDGRMGEAIKVLSQIGTGNQSTRKMRQNLALLHAFDGNLEKAEQISRIDLNPEEMKRNLAFFRKIAAVPGEKFVPRRQAPSFDTTKKQEGDTVKKQIENRLSQSPSAKPPYAKKRYPITAKPVALISNDPIRFSNIAPPPPPPHPSPSASKRGGRNTRTMPLPKPKVSFLPRAEKHHSASAVSTTTSKVRAETKIALVSPARSIAPKHRKKQKISTPHCTIQIGSYRQVASLRHAERSLHKAGFKTHNFSSRSYGTTWHVLRTGNYGDCTLARMIAKKLRDRNIAIDAMVRTLK